MIATIVLVTKQDFTHAASGGAIRVKNIAEELHARGINVVGIAAGSAGATSMHTRWFYWRAMVGYVRVLIAYIRVGSVSCVRWLRFSAICSVLAAIERDQPSALLIEHSQMYPYSALFRGPVVLDMHNIEHELLSNYASSATGPYRYAARYEASRVRFLERRAVRNAALVGVVSEHDQQLAVALGAPLTRVVLAANGTSAVGFTTPRSVDEPIVSFVAALDWRPNIDAAKWLASSVWPLVRRALPAASLWIIGRSPSHEVRRLSSESGIEVFADVESVGPYLSKSAVATAPLLSAGGTRLKIVEALSFGVPVVATSLGAMGLESREGMGLHITDDPGEFALAILHYIAEPPDHDEVRNAVDDMRWTHTLDTFASRVGELAGSNSWCTK